MGKDLNKRHYELGLSPKGNFKTFLIDDCPSVHEARAVSRINDYIIKRPKKIIIPVRKNKAQ